MSDPIWLEKLRKEGRISETTVNREVLAAAQGNHVSRAIRAHEGMSEAQFQQAVIDLAHAHGWKVAHFRKVRVANAHGETHWETPAAADGKGWPDLVLARDGKVLFWELKVPPNKPTDEQRAWLRLLGGVVCYPDQWEGMVRILTTPRTPHEAQELQRAADDGNPHHGDD